MECQRTTANQRHKFAFAAGRVVVGWWEVMGRAGAGGTWGHPWVAARM
jgi:hypothetical protein